MTVPLRRVGHHSTKAGMHQQDSHHGGWYVPRKGNSFTHPWGNTSSRTDDHRSSDDHHERLESTLRVWTIKLASDLNMPWHSAFEPCGP